MEPDNVLRKRIIMFYAVTDDVIQLSIAKARLT